VDNKLKQVVDRLELEKKLTDFVKVFTNAIASLKSEISTLAGKVNSTTSQLEQKITTSTKEVISVTDTIASDVVKTNESVKEVQSQVKEVDSDLQATKKDLTDKIARVKTIKGDRGERGERGEIGPIGPVGPKGADGKNGKDGVTKTIRETVETKTPLQKEDFEVIADGLTNGILLEKKMTSKAIRDFRERTIEIASQIKKGDNGVTKIVAGDNITISPNEGIGEVTINATGGGGDVTSVDGQTGKVDLSGSYEPKNDNIQSHISDTNNPHSVTAEQIGALTSAIIDGGVPSSVYTPTTLVNGGIV
jgi:hypothetical protein